MLALRWLWFLVWLHVDFEESGDCFGQITLVAAEY